MSKREPFCLKKGLVFSDMLFRAGLQKVLCGRLGWPTVPAEGGERMEFAFERLSLPATGLAEVAKRGGPSSCFCPHFRF